MEEALIKIDEAQAIEEDVEMQGVVNTSSIITVL